MSLSSRSWRGLVLLLMLGSHPALCQEGYSSEAPSVPAKQYSRAFTISIQQEACAKAPKVARLSLRVLKETLRIGDRLNSTASDDSRASDYVVEAYDANGKFLPSVPVYVSAASQGRTIDYDPGTIFRNGSTDYWEARVPGKIDVMASWACAPDAASAVQDTVTVEVVDGWHSVPDAARAELAPAGVIRAGMNLDNTLFTTRDGTSGELRGVSVDIMRELAARLEVPVEFVVHATPGQVADAAQQGTWDVALLAIEDSRAETIAFSPPLTEIEATYIVRRDSRLRTIGQVDVTGVRIAAPDRAGYERYLTRVLRNATLVRTQNIPASVELFNANGADAVAGLRPILLEAAARMPGARLLEGNFMLVNHGLGVPRAHRAAADYLEVFVRELVATGFIARSIEQHGVDGLRAVEW